MRVTTSVSIEADQDYKDSLAILARQKKTTVARLVKAAMDAMFGSDLSSETASFVADSVTRKQRSEHVGNGGSHAA